MWTWTLLAAALAAPRDYRVSGAGGLGGGLGSPSPFGGGAPSGVGHGVGRLVFHGQRVSLELGGREGLASEDSRSWGGLFVGPRFELGHALHARVGFAHHHEVELELARAHPLEAALGSLDGIRHRSGLEAGLGLTVPVEERMLGDRLAVGLDLSALAFPDEHGPRTYAFLELNVGLGFGPRRAAPAG